MRLAPDVMGNLALSNATINVVPIGTTAVAVLRFRVSRNTHAE